MDPGQHSTTHLPSQDPETISSSNVEVHDGQGNPSGSLTDPSRRYNFRSILHALRQPRNKTTTNMISGANNSDHHLSAIPQHRPNLTLFRRFSQQSGHASPAIVHNIQHLSKRRKFILKLAKALLVFGAPSHRIESQLLAASDILNAEAGLIPVTPPF
ncbi:hypothetical protein AX16_009725 [Volvariella volvacea WC 439]|nr:hypothetical protein AX16_009725 [Volvariella volvacea WC 439]